MERVVFKNVSIETTTDVRRAVAPLFLDIEKRHADSKVGKIRDVTFEGLEIRTGSGVLIQGMPESPIEKLTLRNIRVTVENPDDYADRKKPVGGRRTTRDERDTCFARLPSYFTVAHARDILVEDLRVEIAEDAFRKLEDLLKGSGNESDTTNAAGALEVEAVAAATPAADATEPCE